VGNGKVATYGQVAAASLTSAVMAANAHGALALSARALVQCRSEFLGNSHHFTSFSGHTEISQPYHKHLGQPLG